MENKEQLNRLESDLDILKCDMILIRKALKQLLAVKKQDEITFKVEGDTLVGTLNNYNKRIFRTNND